MGKQTRPVAPIARGHVVRRVPTPSELRSRAPIALTERDRQVLRAVADFGVLSTDLLVRAYFPAISSERRVPSSGAYNRLRLLWLWSFLDRVELPVARTIGGRRPFLYTLGRRGVAWLGDETDGAEPVARRRLGRIDDRFLDHDLTAAAFWASLVAALRGGRARLERWVTEGTIRAHWERLARTGTRPPAAIPDGIAEIRYPDDTVQCCLLEVDWGTLALRRFRRKVEGFERIRADGQVRDWLGDDDFEVIVLAPSPRRLEHLRAAARDAVEAERWAAYRFATVAALEDRRFTDRCWIDLDGRESTLLDADAFDSTTEGVAHADGGDVSG